MLPLHASSRNQPFGLIDSERARHSFLVSEGCYANRRHTLRYYDRCNCIRMNLDRIVTFLRSRTKHTNATPSPPDPAIEFLHPENVELFVRLGRTPRSPVRQESDVGHGWLRNSIASRF